MSNDHPAFTASHAQSYAANARRQVPGLDGLHKMAALLLAERVADYGQILVLGAGGGLELKALADAQSGWWFEGVDPSGAMLETATEVADEHMPRIRLVEGYIDAASEGPFDGAVCFLTLHFVPREERLETLRQVHARLKPGAPFVVAHISFEQAEPERSVWIARHVAFGGVDAANVESAKHAIATRLSILSPAEDETMLRQAGFSDISLFYAGLTIRGWVGYA